MTGVERTGVGREKGVGREQRAGTEEGRGENRGGVRRRGGERRGLCGRLGGRGWKAESRGWGLF